MHVFRSFVRPQFCLAVIGLCLIAACDKGPARFEASGHAITTPQPGTPFSQYITDSETKIRTALQDLRYSPEPHPFDDYSIDDAVSMRAPFAIEPDMQACRQSGKTIENGDGVGFLLVHGLSDSPYLMSDIAMSLHTALPCATLHALLLPGHGTVPGDLRDVDASAWQATVKYGLESFDDNIRHIIPVGYSMGAALVVRAAENHRNDAELSAMVLLSPGFGAYSDLAWLTPYMRYVKPWVDKRRDHDVAKYESLAMNAAAEFQLLTVPFGENTLPPITQPVFMAVSSDDRTIRADLAAHFFCGKVQSDDRYMIWYQGEEKASQDRPQPICDDIDVVTSANPDLRTVNHAHTALTMRPQNPHYGLTGDYRRCDHYREPADYKTCEEDNKDTIYGETNLLESATPGTLRRGTFNPDFDGMMGKMVVFIHKALEP
ncbi:alpha/beta hydrolase [Thalassospira mesophila]|uniref:alpha/beta hydrolase n=1 Tax=Thalassospira mesophila TaxID=1293891 RepID=UPI000A1DDE01|nr:alpha/beta fold hydrolase [Thalassospira mesophila]